MFFFFFSGLIGFLYLLSFCLLGGLSLFIAFRGSRTHARSRLRITFFLLALSLLVWQVTLFVEVRITSPVAQLWISRINFTAIVFVTYLAFRFIQEVAQAKSGSLSARSIWYLFETGILAGLTLFTPLVDASEQVIDERAISTFGPLFPVYLLHVVGYLLAALILAFWEKHRAKKPAIRKQLYLIGVGVLMTGGIAFITNAVMPYRFDDFRLCDIGVISTLFFACSVGWATFMHRLFDVRVLIRETLVYGILLAFVLSAYSAAVFLVTEYLTGGQDKVKQFAVLIIAFSFDPIRRVLESKTDRLLFGESTDTNVVNKRRKRRR